ncbi:hypothetical protein CPB83DRAFT_748494, partial [Crepidotus variabilis]
PQVGARICLNSHIGTVRFVGPVDSTNGIWIGVEWDDPSRGKHDGSKDGKQSKISGSFIRPTAGVQYGVSFLEALTSKYIEALHGSETQEKVLLGSSAGAIEVEAVSLDKIRRKFARLDHLREISLDNANIVRGDSNGSISQTCPNIRGLDLSQNLLSSWEVVAQITREMPLLERLALNRNRLQLPSCSESLLDAFQKISEIQLNNTLLTWAEICWLMAILPRLQVLEVGYNQLTSLALHHSLGQFPQLSSLQSLNLDSNLFSDWVHICTVLKEYPNLQRLILTANNIESIPLLLNQQRNDTFPSLRYLFLSDNQISSWNSIDALSTWLPNLQSLSLSGNPLVHGIDNEKHARPFTIARVPNLVMLDGTSITFRERTDSELFYLSQIIQQGVQTEAQRQEEHPRWAVLCELHGRPNEIQNLPTAPDKLSNHLMGLYFFLTDKLPISLQNGSYRSRVISQGGCTMDHSKKISMQVLPSMSLRILRIKICKVLKLDVRRTKLRCWLRMWDGSFAELEAVNNTRDLDWLGLENGSQLI